VNFAGNDPVLVALTSTEVKTTTNGFEGAGEIDNLVVWMFEVLWSHEAAVDVDVASMVSPGLRGV
jgi:hypothetical protein